MNIVITGGAGFLGRKLATALRESPLGASRRITLADLPAEADVPAGCDYVSADITSPGVIESLIADDTDVVVHLAAVVSAGAEADFDLGMRVNVDGTRALLERCRALAHRPRVVFTSSVAAFGEAPPLVTDDTPTIPQSSYGTQKVIGELLLADYSRKGYVDGICLRLPTIVIRPGKPNAAASSFASGILREPLNGVATVCPVSPDLGLWIASPRAAIRALVHAISLEDAEIGNRRTLNIPGLSATVSEMLDALERHGGDRALVTFEPDERIGAIVGTWPPAMDTPRAHALGFEPDGSLDALIEAYLEDDAPGRAS